MISDSRDGSEGAGKKWPQVPEEFKPHLFNLHQETSVSQATPMLWPCWSRASPFSFSVFMSSIPPKRSFTSPWIYFGIIMSVNIPNDRQADFYRKSHYCWMLIFLKALENLTLYSLALTDLSGMLCISKQLRTELGSSQSLHFSALQRLYFKGGKSDPLLSVTWPALNH